MDVDEGVARADARNAAILDNRDQRIAAPPVESDKLQAAPTGAYCRHAEFQRLTHLERGGGCLDRQIEKTERLGRHLLATSRNKGDAERQMPQPPGRTPSAEGRVKRDRHFGSSEWLMKLRTMVADDAAAGVQKPQWAGRLRFVGAGSVDPGDRRSHWPEVSADLTSVMNDIEQEAPRHWRGWTRMPHEVQRPLPLLEQKGRPSFSHSRTLRHVCLENVPHRGWHR